MSVEWGTAIRGAEAGATVGTDTIDSVTIRLLEAHETYGLVVIEGPAGVGKSYSSARAAEAMLDRHPGLEVVHIELARSIQGRSLLVDLYAQIMGVVPHQRATERELRNELGSALQRSDRLVIVDEAQHVGRMALTTLRWLHDRPKARFTLVMIGMTGIWSQIPREIQSRCSSRIQAGRLPDDQVQQLLTDYHSIFTSFDPAALRQTNRTRARGEFRWWAKFLARTLRYAPQLPEAPWDATVINQISEDMP